MKQELVMAWIDENTGVRLMGYVIDTAYCQVTNKWSVLVAGDDGKFHSVHAEGLEVKAMWALGEENE